MTPDYKDFKCLINKTLPQINLYEIILNNRNSFSGILLNHHSVSEEKKSIKLIKTKEK